MENDTQREDAIGKAARLATNEAKNVIMAWADRFDDEDDKLATAIVSSIQVSADVIDVAINIDDDQIASNTLLQIEGVLEPMIAKLREHLAAKVGTVN